MEENTLDYIIVTQDNLASDVMAEHLGSYNHKLVLVNISNHSLATDKNVAKS